MQRTAIINVVGLTPRLIGDAMPETRAFAERHAGTVIAPAFPAVTCTAQSTYLTGSRPSEHGIVGNGWYDREQAEHQFWKQSNHLVHGHKLWDELRERDPDFTCAKLFWWYNMYATADFTVTPRPLYLPDGRKIFDIYTQPMGLRERIKKDLGDFPFRHFWGPASDIRSTAWIAETAKWVEEKHWPGLSLVYLPHLDYNLQRLGIDDMAALAPDLNALDTVLGELIRFYEKRHIKVVLLSEYGLTSVDRPVHLNRIFREKGWIAIKEDLGRESLDLGASKAFAIADHQVAHVYVNDPSIRDEVLSVLERTEGVETVLGEIGKRERGVDHARAGDFIAIAEARSWFTFYFWTDDKRAPEYARCVDIHRKPGYDPVELFIDPGLKAPKLSVAWRLLKKTLGFRMMMDVIPLDASLVKGSHGRVPEDQADWPVFIGDFADLPEDAPIRAEEVYGYLLRHCSEGHGYQRADL